MISKSRINKRDLILSIIMIGAAFFVYLNPPRKSAPGEKIHLNTFVPEKLWGWRSITRDTSGFEDIRWQAINELMIRTFYKHDKSFVNLILEYGSDLRKNFTFHFPENCHRAGGNEIDFLEPIKVELKDGRVIMMKYLFIKGLPDTTVERDKFVAYWLTIDKKQYHETFWIKLDQMLSGLLKQSKSGFLFRVDYVDRVKYDDESEARARELIIDFTRDMYDKLDEEKKALIFGETRPPVVAGRDTD
ncbi:MAG: EpsI family protein [Candidatus Omnitrophica bacterium]|nr:EpsI family protein [Candidatus Omnitrophota bacterium]